MHTGSGAAKAPSCVCPGAFPGCLQRRPPTSSALYCLPGREGSWWVQGHRGRENVYRSRGSGPTRLQLQGWLHAAARSPGRRWNVPSKQTLLRKAEHSGAKLGQSHCPAGAYVFLSVFPAGTEGVDGTASPESNQTLQCLGTGASNSAIRCACAPENPSHGTREAPGMFVAAAFVAVRGCETKGAVKRGLEKKDELFSHQMP